MLVTAKLSREFYDKFGDKIADEFVNWFNQVDATYRSDLHAINELNFGRFDARLEQRFAESDARWERRTAELDTRWEHRVGELKTSLVLWMFGFWTASTFIVLSTTVAILKL